MAPVVKHRLIEARGPRATCTYMFRHRGQFVGNPFKGKANDMIEAMTTVVTSGGIVDLRFQIDVDVLSRQPWDV